MKQYYTGRKKIVIPVTVKQFRKNPTAWIKKYFNNCLSDNDTNKIEFDQLNMQFKGEQSVWQKERADKTNEINSQVEVNHLWRQVNFKKGFMVGKPIEYALATSIETDDMTYLNKYLRDSMKASKDIDKYEDLYIGGIAYQFIIPKIEDFDVENEAPFELCNIEVGNAFTVYSNDITNKRLFDVVISSRSELESNYSKTKTIYDIFYLKEDGYCYSISMIKNNMWEIINNEEEKQSYKFLPLIEYTLNKGRMGIIEVVLAIQNTLNVIHSNQVDDIIEFVNSYIVFKNQKVDKKFEEKFKEFKKMRVLAIYSQNPQLPAEVSLLKQSLNHTDINAFYELLKNEMYDIVGVPQSSGNVTSGGDTGSARLLGNGWESAQNQAEVDTSYVQQYEYELLKKILLICKDTYNCPINEIYPSDVEIKFSINMSNNLLIKSQSLKYLYDMNMPYDEALTMTGITGDTHGVGEKWKQNDEEKLRLEQEQEIQKQEVKKQSDINE